MYGTIGSVSDWRFTKARGKEDEVYDQNNKQTDNVSSRISSGLAWISWDLSVLQCNMKFRTIMYVAALNRNFDSDGAFEGSNCSPIFMKPSGTLQNIRLQTPRHRSLFDRRGRSFSLSPLFIDQPHIFLAMHFQWTNFKYAVEGANQVPRRSIYKAAPARLIHQSPSHSRHQHVKANTDCIDPKVSEGKYEVNEQDWQMDTMPSHASSGIGLNLLKFIR